MEYYDRRVLGSSTTRNKVIKQFIQVFISYIRLSRRLEEVFEASGIETLSVSRPGSPPGESLSEIEKKYEIDKHSRKIIKMISVFIILNEFDYGSRLNIGSGLNKIYRHLMQQDFIPCTSPVLKDFSRKHGTDASV